MHEVRGEWIHHIPSIGGQRTYTFGRPWQNLARFCQASPQHPEFLQCRCTLLPLEQHRRASKLLPILKCECRNRDKKGSFWLLMRHPFIICGCVISLVVVSCVSSLSSIAVIDDVHATQKTRSTCWLANCSHHIPELIIPLQTR